MPWLETTVGIAPSLVSLFKKVGKYVTKEVKGARSGDTRYPIVKRSPQIFKAKQQTPVSQSQMFERSLLLR